jgi:sulfur carrier protein
MTEIIVNGKTMPVPQSCTVQDLLVSMGLEGKRIAVERNDEIVPRSLHDSTRVVEGDRFEIVVAVGGG